MIRKFRTLEIEACKAFEVNPHKTSGTKTKLTYYLKKAFEMGKEGGEICEKCSGVGMISGAICLKCNGVGMIE